MNDAKKYRELAAAFRGVADATDKVADVMEKEDSTPEQMEEAMKNFMWEMAKMQALT